MKKRAGLFAAVAALVLWVPFAGGAAAVPAVSVPTSLVSAGVEDFEFASYDADFFLGIDGAGHSTLRTVETLVAVFPQFDQNRGIIRAIPNYYDGVPLETEVVGVVDENGVAVPFEILSSAEF